MSTQRLKTILYIVAIFLIATLYMKWQVLHAPKPTPKTAQTQIAAKQAHHASQVPSFNATAPTSTSAANPTTHSHHTNSVTGKLITIKTPVLDLKIDLTGGKIISAKLLKYPEKLHSKQSVTLFNTTPGKVYTAQMGFSSKQLPTPDKIQYQSAQSTYTLTSQQNHLNVALTARVNNALITKTFHFTPNSYAISTSEHIQNNATTPIQGRFYTQLVREPVKKKHHMMLGNYYTFTGAALSSSQDHFDKLSFSDLADKDRNVSTQSGWAAMVQHYFISAWVPVGQHLNQLFTRNYQNSFGVGIAYPQATIPAKHSYEAQAKLYVGPAIAHKLDKVAPYLSKTIDYGWLWFISDIIFAVMAWIHLLIGNWGWSIIIVTILIKVLFAPLSAKSYKSMAKMRKLTPRIKLLKERYGDDRQALGKATMDMYRQEKVNPVGGCLPMIIQIPVFFALYWVIIESVELRQAPFIFWIHDLSVRDPYFILPILMGLSMFAQQRLNPTPADPMQAKMMMFLPIIFTVMFAFFPSGLVLYWLTNNLCSMAQQYWVMRSVNKQDAAKAKKRR